MKRSQFLDIVSIILIVASVLVFSTGISLADFSQYNLTWDASGIVYQTNNSTRLANYRHFQLVQADNSSIASDWVCIGPAEWEVKGNINSTQSISERWTAVSWNDVVNIWDAVNNMSYRYSNIPGCANPNGLQVNNISGHPWGIKPSGEYGVSLIELLGYSNIYKSQWQSAASWPTKWNVKGCVYDGSETQCPYDTR